MVLRVMEKNEAGKREKKFWGIRFYTGEAGKRSFRGWHLSKAKQIPEGRAIQAVQTSRIKAKKKECDSYFQGRTRWPVYTAAE